MENSSQLWDFIKDFLKDNLLVVVMFALGLILLGGSLMLFSNNNKSDVILEKDLSPTVKIENQSKIKVDIEGAIEKPGVYDLKNDARIQDALVASGGLAEEADREYVQKKINLAQKLTDGMKVYIPKIGEVVTNSSQAEIGGSDSSMININSAQVSELDSLPGVGPVTAQKIIDGRPYGSVEELVERKVVSSSVFTKIKDKITY